MTLLAAIFSALFGLAFGSFLNVCISRLPRYQSIVRPPSHCPNCKKFILMQDNIPFLSWFLLRGHCRYCRWPIPRRYPLIELGTASLFLLIYLVFGLTFEAAGMTLLCVLLLGLAVMDAETMLLPDTFTIPGIASGVLYSGLDGGARAALWSLLYALLAGLLLFVIRGAYFFLRHREGMGLGDAKLFAMIAAWLGPERALLALFLGVVAAAIFGVIWISIKQRSKKPQPSQQTMKSKASDHPIPLGSFLSAAGLYAIFFGHQTLKWYIHFFR